MLNDLLVQRSLLLFTRLHRSVTLALRPVSIAEVIQARIGREVSQDAALGQLLRLVRNTGGCVFALTTDLRTSRGVRRPIERVSIDFIRLFPVPLRSLVHRLVLVRRLKPDRP